MEDKNELALMNDLVQPVVRLDPNHQDFKIWKAQGQEQLEAARVFVERIPAYVAELMGRDFEKGLLDTADTAVKAEETLNSATGQNINAAESFRDAMRKVLFDSITASDLQDAASNQKNATKKKQLQLLADNWRSIKAWVLGATVHDDRENTDKVAKTMIPIHEDVLQMMLDTGWKWGGDWGKGTRKDYMHFEDPEALELLRLEEEEEDEKAKK